MTDAFPSRITVKHALELLRAAAAERGRATEQVATRRADGRVLAADVVAPIPLPAFDNSAMDGFAVRHADLSAAAPVTLELAGEQFAGPDLGLAVGPGQCVRITTGAPLPSGADTIVIREDAIEQDGRVQVPAGIRAGAHVRRQGEDVATGDVVLRAGQVLTPARIGLAAALGIDRLEVAARPTVAVFASGDELAEPGMPLRPGQVYNSNREQLMAQLRDAGLEPVAWPTLPDDPVLIAAVLDDAVENFDLVLTCGAVSAGEKDHLPRWLQARGRIRFWKVRMRPGMPVLFGEAGRALVLGLPGNPVSVLATFHVFGRTLLDALQGREPRPCWRARLAAPWHKRHDRLEFLRGRLDQDANATLCVHPEPADGSHRLRAAASSDVLIVLEDGANAYVAGDVVEVLPL
ncbi:molybdenum cofactor synthesis domain protein [Pseudoxanthomonas suwonensis 11-1]|uniref:Molybdopterin molybdenumtransferase n=1 Tax=Pseudoxanthomonas suwonensis (strain 11-1) TaxID=743721 RepID=E6WSN5_PSEUU|nr:gephyrin-like molybdotransferase Glp [Pseudoxanthomonas suwonensis]ADV27249.1 molybdenum cofactor synthesis domain protein [Pseudoxanthomonas suwonensis 11-1]